MEMPTNFNRPSCGSRPPATASLPRHVTRHTPSPSASQTACPPLRAVKGAPRSGVCRQVSVLPAHRRWFSAGPTLLAVAAVVAVVAGPCTAKISGPHTWQAPGCHKIGHTRRISIPDCVEFDITTNACRGYCESWSVLASHTSPRLPSPFPDQDTTSPRLMTAFMDQLGSAAYGPPQQKPQVTSVGQCCNIMDSEDVKVMVMCVDGPRELAFKSAKTCACFHCKKY